MVGEKGDDVVLRICTKLDPAWFSGVGVGRDGDTTLKRDEYVSV